MRTLVLIERFIMERYRLLSYRKDAFLAKFLTPLVRLGIQADMISLLGLASGIVAAIYLHYSRMLFLVFWLGKRFADIIDGPVSRINKTNIFRNVNMDRVCDLSFSIILLLSTIPIVGIFWPIIAVITHLIHIRFDGDTMGGVSLFAPANWAQFFFIFKLIEEGLVAQCIFTVIAFILRRLSES